jgi:S-DNA-T family DNA segregation ATPase FtsK/SpoIIIE
LIVAAGRSDSVRAGGLSHWTSRLRRARLGVLLQPDIHLDGEILGTKIPLQAPVAMTAGRGYLVNAGAAELIHMALS